MSDTSHDSRKKTFADSDPLSADEIKYRAVSPLAILVLLLGFAAPLAFLSPLLWVFPAFAVGLGLFALSRLQRDADRYTGAGLAWAGVLLGLLFLGWAPARYMQRLSILEARASAVAREWTALVCEGRLQDAHQWHLHATARAKPGVSVAAFYAERPETAKLQQDFFANGVLLQWLKRGQGTTAKYIGYLGRESTGVGGGENYVFEFVVRGPAGKGDLPIFVVITRELRETGDAEMFVANVLGVNPFIKER